MAHPEVGTTWTYPVRKWLSTEPAWKVCRRAPLVDEDSARVWTDLAGARPRPPVDDAMLATLTPRAPHQKPMPLDGVRVLDFTWFLASAGGTQQTARSLIPNANACLLPTVVHLESCV